MKWADKWHKELDSGYYVKLLEKGFLKEEDYEPDIGPFSFYLDAFGELSTCRMNGMAIGAIPFTAIAEYSRLYEVGEFEEFVTIIRKMDHTFIKLMNERSKKENKSSGSNNPSKTNQN